MAGRPFTPALDICLIRAIRLGRQMYPVQALEWIFPADSESGHLAETKKDREILSKWGNALRQTFRTIATAAGVSEIDAKLLMNPAIPSVNAGYITRQAFREPSTEPAASNKQCSIYSAGRIDHARLRCSIGSGGAPPPGRNHLRWETVRSTLGCWNDAGIILKAAR